MEQETLLEYMYNMSPLVTKDCDCVMMILAKWKHDYWLLCEPRSTKQRYKFLNAINFLH
jgi:hypothetical protein